MFSKKNRESFFTLRLLEDKLRAQVNGNVRIVITLNMDESGMIVLYTGEGHAEYLDCFGTALNTFDDAISRVYPTVVERFSLQ